MKESNVMANKICTFNLRDFFRLLPVSLLRRRRRLVTCLWINVDPRCRTVRKTDDFFSIPSSSRMWGELFIGVSSLLLGSSGRDDKGCVSTTARLRFLLCVSLHVRCTCIDIFLVCMRTKWKMRQWKIDVRRRGISTKETQYVNEMALSVSLLEYSWQNIFPPAPGKTFTWMSEGIE